MRSALAGAPGIGRIVKCSGVDDGPVEEVFAPVTRVPVEDVAASDSNATARRRAFQRLMLQVL